MSERDVERAFSDAASTIVPPSEDDLRALARSAAAHARPARGTRRRVTPGRAAAAVVVALVAGSALGFGLASSLTPSGGAADPAPGLGFLPERGWNVARSRFEASPERPSFAFASNGPLDRIDVSLARSPNFAGAPHLTLQSMRSRDIVLVASFSLRGVHEPSDDSFPRRSLPLRLRDAATTASLTRSARYELRAAVGEHNLVVDVYFGTARPSSAQMVAAQRQLDRLVVGSTRPVARVAERALDPAARMAVSSGQAGMFDRTFACLPLAFGAARDLDFVVSPARVDVVGRRFAAVIEARTGAQSASTSLVLARARQQHEHPGLAYEAPVKGAAGAFANRKRCRAVRTPVPLSARGLPGPPVRWQKDLDCPIRGRVLVRVRAVLETSTTWRRIDSTYDGARNPLAKAQLAVRSERTGKPIAYMEISGDEKIKLWYSGACG